MRTHAADCRRLYQTADAEWHDLRPGAIVPADAMRWHSATCETQSEQRAYALSCARPRDRFIVDDDGRRVDQAPRYARAILELIYG